MLIQAAQEDLRTLYHASIAQFNRGTEKEQEVEREQQAKERKVQRQFVKRVYYTEQVKRDLALVGLFRGVVGLGECRLIAALHPRPNESLWHTMLLGDMLLTNAGWRVAWLYEYRFAQAQGRHKQRSRKRSLGVACSSSFECLFLSLDLYIYTHFNLHTCVVPSGCMRLVSDIAPSNNKMDMDNEVSNTVRRTLMLPSPKKIQRTGQSANRSNDQDA